MLDDITSLQLKSLDISPRVLNLWHPTEARNATQRRWPSSPTVTGARIMRVYICTTCSKSFCLTNSQSDDDNKQTLSCHQDTWVQPANESQAAKQQSKSHEDSGATTRSDHNFPSKQKVIVKGINTKTKHVKPTQKSESGKLSFFEAPIHYSNVKYEQGEL